MVKRATAGLLWFAAGLFAAELAEYFTGTSRLIGPIVAFAIAAFVVLDPLHLFWPSADVNGPIDVEVFDPI